MQKMNSIGDVFVHAGTIIADEWALIEYVQTHYGNGFRFLIDAEPGTTTTLTSNNDNLHGEAL